MAAALALLAGAVLAAVAACAENPPPDSGVRGVVSLGPLEPVTREGTTSSSRPYEATIRVLRTGSGDEVATVRSGADGRFSVNLAPGAYTLEPLPGEPGGLPHAPPQDVTVEPHRFVTVRIDYDTGIR